MTEREVQTTYRYASDGHLLTTTLWPDRVRRRRLATTLTAAVLVVVLLGVAGSLVTNRASLPDYLVDVILIGLKWGLITSLLGLAAGIALSIPLVLANWRYFARRYPSGSVTEVVIGEDAVVVAGPTGKRTLPYRLIRGVRVRGSWVTLATRKGVGFEILPVEMFPGEVIDFIRTRSSGRWPQGAHSEELLGSHGQYREFVVPPGWSTHVAVAASVHSVRSRRYWLRVGLWLILSLVLAALFGRWWLLLLPLLILLSLARTYWVTRQVVGSALPTGSVASAVLTSDHLVSRNAGGLRRIDRDDVISAHVVGDVVLLVLGTQPGPLALARTLVPDEFLEQFRPGSATTS